MTTGEALKHLKRDFLNESETKIKAILKAVNVIERISGVMSNYDLSCFDEKEIYDLTIVEIVENFKRFFDDLTEIKNLVQ